MRETLFEAIQALRWRIGDTGATPVLADSELQSILDGQRVDVRYLALDPLPTLTPTGAQYLAFAAPREYAGRQWEGGETLTDGAYTTLTGYTADHVNGRWTFTEHQEPPVFLISACYDLAAAAADALERWAGRLKLNYDFSADGASFHRSQQVQALLALAREQRRQALPRLAQTRVG